MDAAHAIGKKAPRGRQGKGVRAAMRKKWNRRRDLDMVEYNSKCPRCNHDCDGVIQTEPDSEPRPGDIIICSNCAAITIVESDGGGRREATDEDFEEIEKIQPGLVHEILKLQEVTQDIRRKVDRE